MNDEFTTKHQRNDSHDKYAVAVRKTDAEIVGHLPRELSKICCLLILHGLLVSLKEDDAKPVSHVVEWRSHVD